MDSNNTQSTVFIAPFVEDQFSATYTPVNLDFPGLERLNQYPPVYIVHDFLTNEECEILITEATPGLKRSIVVDGKAGKSPAPSRTSESCYLLKDKTVWLGEKVTRLLSGKSHDTQEPPQVARYQKEQYYLPHFDAFDVTTAPGRECLLTGGQRVATVLMYLNDVPKKGGTFFPRLNLRVSPKKGKALIFFPCALGGFLDKLALHEAETAEDEKFVCQVWVREGSFQ